MTDGEIHWPAAGIGHGSETDTEEDTVAGLVLLAGVVAQLTTLALVGSLAVVAYVRLTAAGVFTGTAPVAGIALAAGVLFVADLAVKRLITSPVAFAADVLAVVSVTPLVVATVLLRRDTSVPTRLFRRVRSRSVAGTLLVE